MNRATIYQPKGRAGEYADLAANIYVGCSNHCSYCYAKGILGYTRWANPQPQNNILTRLEHDAGRLSTGEVLLSFLSDPYQQLDESLGLTRRAIQILKSHGLGVRILSKCGVASARDFDLLNKNDWYGATLTFTQASDSLEWEPGAAVPTARMEVLQEAHERGIRTWASIEPVIDPAQSLSLIAQTAPYVDHFKVGKWNHDKRASEIDWTTFRRDAVNLLKGLDKSYYIKRDLALLGDNRRQEGPE